MLRSKTVIVADYCKSLLGKIHAIELIRLCCSVYPSAAVEVNYSRQRTAFSFGTVDIKKSVLLIPAVSDIKETLDVNFIGTFALTKALIPLLTKNNGRIANVTVPSEISPYWHPLAYVASKAAQNAMMGVMAIEFQQSNTPVEVFSVHPGPTTTDLNDNMALPGFHDIETVGQKFSELINDGQNHQGEFIELYPIVKED